jgi:hypothetical protein
VPDGVIGEADSAQLGVGDVAVLPAGDDRHLEVFGA